MKSMNFISSAGSMIFLLLVVSSAYGANWGDDCQYVHRCDEIRYPDIDCYTGAKKEKGSLAANRPDEHDDQVLPNPSTERHGIGKCLCKEKEHTWNSVEWKCVKLSGSPRHLFETENSKEHGDTCAGMDSCKHGTECRIGGTKGDPASTKNGKSDGRGEGPWTDSTPAGTKGVCVCVDPTMNHFDDTEKKCAVGAKTTDPDTTKGHGQECDITTQLCRSPFKCHVDGIKGEKDKPDKEGTEYTATSTKPGICICAGSLAYNKATYTCEAAGGKGDGSTPPGGGGGGSGSGSKSGSYRIVYQPISLLLTIMTAIGSLFL